MTFSSIVRALGRSPLTNELLTKLNKQQDIYLNGIARLPKGLVSSALAKSEGQNLCVVCATLEEAGRWTAQLEAMGWKDVLFYPTSEASPYEGFDPETEMTWGQMQVLADLVKINHGHGALGNGDRENKTNASLPSSNPASQIAIVATVGSLQPHLPPIEAFKPFCLTIKKGMEYDLDDFSDRVTNLGYDRVSLVETEGQWSRRGDIVDIFPVSSELPVRLEWFGDEIEQIREFDPATQRSALDKVQEVVLTPTTFGVIIQQDLHNSAEWKQLSAESKSQLQFNPENSIQLEGSRRFLGFAYNKPSSLLDYLPKNTFIAIDEPEQCHAHSDRWVEHAEEKWKLGNGELGIGDGELGIGEDVENINLPIPNSCTDDPVGRLSHISYIKDDPSG
ncbi:MAG: hypothetical protein HC903_01925 [Methylacidiphilales bacterium]|nr:hypothetical protein [Candidatus Methylacidiphilales bacterium]